MVLLSVHQTKKSLQEGQFSQTVGKLITVSIPRISQSMHRRGVILHKEKQLKNECIFSKCRYIARCQVYHGDNCIKLEGGKVPVMCAVSEAREIKKPSGFKAKFVDFEIGGIEL